MTTAAENPSSVPSPSSVRIPGTGRNNQWSEEWWSTAPPNVKRCTAHNRKGNQCLHAAMNQTNVCRVHGGAAPQVKRAARIRLEMAADRMARQLLGIADSGQSEAVRLAAIKDALDRSGIQAKTAVDVAVSVKPYERVFDRISAGPREPARNELPESSDTAIESGEDDEVIGEFDDDEIDDDPYVPRVGRESESADDPRIVDVEVVADEYTDAMSDGSGTITPEDSHESLSVDPGLMPGPLGMREPAGSGLMPLDAAVEAASVMRQREAARIRNMRRR